MQLLCLVITALFYAAYAATTAWAIFDFHKGRSHESQWPHFWVHALGCLSYSLLAATSLLERH